MSTQWNRTMNGTHWNTSQCGSHARITSNKCALTAVFLHRFIISVRGRKKEITAMKSMKSSPHAQYRVRANRTLHLPLGKRPCRAAMHYTLCMEPRSALHHPWSTNQETNTVQIRHSNFYKSFPRNWTNFSNRDGKKSGTLGTRTNQPENQAYINTLFHTIKKCGPFLFVTLRTFDTNIRIDQSVVFFPSSV